MPKGPKGEKRPADVIGNAVKIAQIATGEIDDDVTDDGKDKAAQALGRKGGKARASSLTKEQRSDIAKAAAKARWEGHEKSTEQERASEAKSSRKPVRAKIPSPDE